MTKETVLIAETRKESGSLGARRLRRGGWLPGVVNNDKGKSHMIRMSKHDFEMFLHAHEGEQLMVDVAIDGTKSQKMLLKEVQHHPVTGAPIHAEFMEVSMTKKMRVKVPLILRGDPEGVTKEGGILEQLIREIEIECLPADIVESIEVDVSHLTLGKSLHAGELKVNSKIAIVTEKSIAIAAVVALKEEALPTAEDAAAVAVAGTDAAAGVVAEPEVIGEKEREERRAAKEKEKGGDAAGKGAPKDAAKGAAKDAGKSAAPAGKDAGKGAAAKGPAKG